MSKNFAITGVAGYVAPRHLRAIRDTGNTLVAAMDPHDSVGILDRYFHDVAYFREFERFDRHVEKLRRGSAKKRVDYVSICSPNFLHDAHIRFALRMQADAICEKPLVMNPWNCDALEELENEQEQRVYTILQLRLHDAVREMKERFGSTKGRKHQVSLTYIASRGQWYAHSWKGNISQSGGIATNIGIHFFDLLTWIFGGVEDLQVNLAEPQRSAGQLELERAKVNWFLSIDRHDLPQDRSSGEKMTDRRLEIDGEELDLSTGFDNLHTRAYEEIFAGRGVRIAEVRPSVQLVHDIRHDDAHPLIHQITGV